MMDESFKTYVVVNPHSSNGRTAHRWPELKQLIQEKTGPFDHVFTAHPRQATDLTREALSRGYEMIVSVGGDGTHHEVVNGFFDGKTPVQPQACMAILTSGTGGDFRKTFGLAPGPEAGLPALQGRRVRPIDIGWFSYMGNDGTPREGFFLNILSFGIGGLVDHMVNNTTKALGGKTSFFIGTLRAFLKYKAQTVRLRLDEGEERETSIHNIAVANGRFFGGGMQVAPEAVPDDGQFDIVGFEGMSTGGFLSLANRIYSGTHIGRPGVTHTRARIVEAHSSQEVLLDVDGEQEGRLPIRIELLPQAIRLKV